MKKKLFVLLLVIPLLLSGCSDNKNETKEETTNVSTTESTTTTTTKKTTSLAANMYKQVEDGQYHKYTYVFDDEDTCNKKAVGEYGDAAEKSGKVIMFYGCDEVLSQSGETKWGLYYMTGTSKDTKFYW